MAHSLRAGVACVPLSLPLGLPMMGYGARVGGANSQHDPLCARALYLAQDSDVLLVVLDVCLLAPAQARALRTRLAKSTGIAAERIAISCSHTHSGPETGLRAVLDGLAAPPHVAPLLDAAVRVGEEAVARAVLARVGVGRAETRVGRNRRRADGPVDRGVAIVRMDREDGSALGILYMVSCHPTALGHDNLAYSADWPGAASRRIEAEFPGALAIFALGAHGDVDPRTRSLQDIAIEGQSVGVSFEEMEELGSEVGAAVARSAAGIATAPTAAIGGAARTVQLLAHPCTPSEAERAERLAARRSDALHALGLDPGTRMDSQELFRLAHERTRGLPLEERRARLARVRLDLRDRQAVWFASGQVAEVEVQVLRLGPAWLLALPLEPTVDVGLDWQGRIGRFAPGGVAQVLGIANGWLRYLPHGRNFTEPNAEQGYEVLNSTFPPEAAERLLGVGEEIARAAIGGSSSSPS